MDAAEVAVHWVLKQLASLAAWLWELVWPRERRRPVSKPTPRRSQAPNRHTVGRRRLLAEFKHLMLQASDGAIPQLSELELVHDDLYRYGQGKVLMEILFPDSYPLDPFTLRVVRPRMAWYTGHVTAGGTVCLQELSQGGSRCAWHPSYDVASILQLAIINMTSCESVYVRTPTGPGGMSGPLRVDLDGRWHGRSPTAEYSEAEARAALARTEATHSRHGW